MSPQLSFDIQTEIMKRLPVKSLIQFRSVCKAWKSLIDSSPFIAGYSDDQPRHLMTSYSLGEENGVKYVCFVDDDDTFPQQKFFVTIPHLARGAMVIGSSHGLLCLKHYLREPDGFGTEIVYLWNPTIRKSIAIVVPSSVHQPSHYVIGFGVCPETKDPKIVNITYMDSLENPCEVMVFTLRSGEWRCLCSKQLPRKSIQFEGCFQIVVGQFIYWPAYDGNYEDDEVHNLIMSFDLSTDEFREVELPHSLRQTDLSISRLGESLVLLDYYKTNPTDKQVCDVWMMEHGDRKVFTKLFTIKAPDAWVSWIEVFRNNGEPIIVIHDDDDDEDEHFFTQCALVVYEPCLEHIKDLGICGPRCSFSGRSYTYTESLLLLDHDDGHIVKCEALKR